MKDTERYLNAATRGLWGQPRRALRTELAGHIQIRVGELMLTGLSEAEAQRQTLRELGAPQQISRGMATVHTLQSAVKGSLATALMALALLNGVQQSQAQVKAIFGGNISGDPSAYLNVEELKKELEKSGATILPNPDKGYVGTIKLPGADRPEYPIQAWPRNILNQDGQTYLDVKTLMMTLTNTGAKIHLSGWNNPTLSASKATIAIETNDWRVLNDLYGAALITDQRLSLGVPWNVLKAPGETRQITLKNTNLKTGKIYALVIPMSVDWYMNDENGKKISSGTLTLTNNIVQGTQNGQANFRIYNDTKPFKLYPNVAQFQKALDPYRDKLGTWDAKHPAPALLLELTGNFGQDAYKVVPP